MSFKNPYSLLLNVGVQHTPASKDQDKKTRMVNMFIVTWYHIFIVIHLLALVLPKGYSPSFTLNIAGFFCVFVCHLFNKYQYYTLSAFSILSYTLFHYFMLTCFIAPERFIDFFYLIVPCGSLMFFNKTRYSWIFLILSILLFHIPFYYLDAYQSERVLFVPTTLVLLFVINFMIVLYFKKLNTKNEALLAEEKKKVESDKQVIEAQHNSLADLSRFKDKFFINLSHEIRTPLTLINGNVNQIESGEIESHVIESLKHNIASITKLVDDVIDLAKIEKQGLALDLETVPVNKCLSKQFNMFKDLFEQKNILFQVKPLEEDAYVALDTLYFERAVSNVLNNAFKYTPPNGKVTLLALLRGDKIDIKIADTGIGIPEDMLSRVFNRFEQVDNEINKTGGSGIGLSFAQQVIEAHHATIDVSSNNQRGTVFTITLDIVQGVASAVEEIVSFRQEESTEAKVIFIVDDNKQIREYLRNVFKNDTCYLFPDGQKALEAIAELSPSCIISDYMMPLMNGHELVKNIRAKGYTVPTVILTASTDEKTKLDILRLGVDDYLTKPFNEEELKLKVNHLIYNHNQRIEFAKSENEVSLETSSDTIFLTQLNTIIIDNVQNPKFNTDDMAQAMFVSSSTLRRKVKLLTGLTAKQYALSLKMQHARTYIGTNPSASLKEVAYEVGMSNPSRFAKQYEECFGKKP